MHSSRQRRPSLPDTLTDAQLLARVAAFYHHTLLHTPRFHAQLAHWGLATPDLWLAFRLGLADGQLSARLSGLLRHRLTALGVLTPDGTEALANCLVVPIEHRQHGITGFYGYPLDGSPHRTLSIRPGGFLNPPSLRHDAPVHVVGDVLEALHFWQAGLRCVTVQTPLPRTLAAFEPLLHAVRTSVLYLWGTPDDVAAWDTLRGPLRVRGIHLVSGLRAMGDPPPHAGLVPSAPVLTPGATNLDLAAWQTRFAHHLRLHQATERTVEVTVAELRPFFAWLYDHGIDSLVDITTDHIEQYRMVLFYRTYRHQRIALTTQARRLHAVKRFTRFLHEARYTLVDAGGRVPSIATPRHLPRVWLSEDEAAALLDGTPTVTPLDLRTRAMLELFYSSALRNQELCRLTLDALDLTRAEVCVRYGKGRTSRVVPIGRSAATWLETYLVSARPHLVQRAGDTAVFLSVHGHALVRQVCTVLVRQAAHQAGLDKAVTPHVLRHACATHMLRRGASLRYVQALLGHASPVTTQQYTRVDIDDLVAMHARFHPRGRP